MQLSRLTNPTTWCTKCGVFVAITWSLLVVVAAAITIYIEYLELATLRANNFADLGYAHLLGVAIVCAVLWLVGLFCTFGCMVLMRRSAVAQQTVEAELRHSCQDLAEKNAELARFVYTVSHDLRTPLVTIMGYIGLMLDSISDESYADAQRSAVTINRAAKKMQSLLDELLRLSRIGRVCGDYAHKPLNELVEEVLIGLDGLRCEGPKIIIQPNMPMIYGDETRLKELLQNLIENAIKYSGDQESPQIEIRAWVEDKETICCVSDNGIGLEQVYFEKIFDLFEKLDPDTPGSGVGLAVAKRIVEVHHGEIWCESEGPGKGSRFYFSIPQSGQ